MLFSKPHTVRNRLTPGLPTDRIRRPRNCARNRTIAMRVRWTARATKQNIATMPITGCISGRRRRRRLCLWLCLCLCLSIRQELLRPRRRLRVLPTDQLEAPVRLLGNCRAALNPITAIGVNHAELLVDRRAVKMTADDAARSLLAHLCG